VARSGFSDRRSRPFRINVIITLAVRERTDAQPHPPVGYPLLRCRKPRRPVAPSARTLPQGVDSDGKVWLSLVPISKQMCEKLSLLIGKEIQAILSGR
jgi:hypothetical protein